MRESMQVSTASPLAACGSRPASRKPLGVGLVRGEYVRERVVAGHGRIVGHVLRG